MFVACFDSVYATYPINKSDHAEYKVVVYLSAFVACKLQVGVQFVAESRRAVPLLQEEDAFQKAAWQLLAR